MSAIPKETTAVLQHDIDTQPALRELLTENKLMPHQVLKGDLRWEIMMAVWCAFRIGQQNPEK